MPSLTFVQTFYLHCVSRITVQVFTKKIFIFEISSLHLPISDKKTPVLNKPQQTSEIRPPSSHDDSFHCYRMFKTSRNTKAIKIYNIQSYRDNRINTMINKASRSFPSMYPDKIMIAQRDTYFFWPEFSHFFPIVQTIRKLRKLLAENVIINLRSSTTVSTSLTLRLLMSYIYGAPSKARNANVVYIWTYVWQR